MRRPERRRWRALDTAEKAAGEEEQGGDEVEDAADDNAHQAERQQEQSDQWIKHEGGEGQRPADEQENAKE